MKFDLVWKPVARAGKRQIHPTIPGESSLSSRGEVRHFACVRVNYLVGEVLIINNDDDDDSDGGGGGGDDEEEDADGYDGGGKTDVICENY